MKRLEKLPLLCKVFSFMAFICLFVCNNVNVFTVTFDENNASLLNFNDWKELEGILNLTRLGGF